MDTTTHASCLHKVNTYLQRIEEKKALNAFIHTYPEEAQQRAIEVDKRMEEGKAGLLAGMVVGLKDLFCYENHPVTASSAILEGFISQITATSVQRLLAQDAILIGHQNCDEFAMGASNEHSVYGAVAHPLDPSYLPGGSSGGSAAAVASNLCDVALGTDTGGSVRQPAAWCGIIGLKPTYGRISRYGVIEFASSLDTVSILAREIEACAKMLEALAGVDPGDNTSSSQPVPAYHQHLSWNKKARIAYFKEALDHPALDEEVKAHTLKTLKRLTQQGHTVTPVNFPLLEYALPTYLILNTAEGSANLARYDGIRYGQRSSKAQTLDEVYTQTRTQLLGKEVKRRILLGTFVLSARYYDAYYTRAQKVRRRIKEAMETLLETYDFVLLPTSATTAMRRGHTQDDPIKEYLCDLYTVIASVSGLPAISIPNGNTEAGWPIGLQVIGKAFDEKSLLAFSQYLMKNGES
ncbi:MAG: Asp-tRNA(Asn)/Glu-tRNA(Gln) amidotransferase subunit GatA [Bacteroidota bacterium]